MASETRNSNPSPITTQTSVAAMYQTAAYKTIAQIRTKKKTGVLRNRINQNRYGAYGELSDADELGQLGIIACYVPVTWEEILLREGGKITNYCYRASKLRASWTYTE